MNKRIIVIAAAVLLAALGLGLVFMYTQTATRNAAAGQATETMYVASQSIPAGTSLKSAVDNKLIGQTSVAAANLPAGALQTVDDSNSALVAVSDITAGEVIFASRFGSAVRPASAVPIPAGQVAMSMSLGDPARVGSFIQPGSKITIYQRAELKYAGEDAKVKARFEALTPQVTSVFLTDVTVIAVGVKPLAAATPASGGPSVTVPTADAAAADSGALLTVALTPEQAVKFADAQLAGSALWLALQGAETKVDPNRIYTNLDPLPANPTGGTLP